MSRKAMLKVLLTVLVSFSIYAAVPSQDLATAAGKGDISTVESLLASGADVNARSSSGEAALMLASAMGHSKIVELLLAKGADVNAKNYDGVTALMLAVVTKHADIMHALLAKGADVNARTNVDSSDRGGMTVLMYAALGWDAATVEPLVAKGADINTKMSIKEYGVTSIQIAMAKGHKAFFTALSSKGAQVEMPMGMLYWMPTLIKADDHLYKIGVRDIHSAARRGEVSTMEELLAKGANVNSKNEDGETALMFATSGGANGHPAAIELLLTKGADINVKNNNGETALIIAARYGRAAVVEILLAKGADVSVKDNRGKKASDYAKNYAAIKKLFDAKAKK